MHMNRLFGFLSIYFLVLHALGAQDPATMSELERSLEAYDRIMSIENFDEVDAFEALSDLYPHIGETWIDFQNATRAFEPSSAAELEQFYRTSGQKLYESGNYDQALSAFEKSLSFTQQKVGNRQQHPDLSRAYSDIGKTQFHRKKYQEALTATDKSMQANSTTPQVSMREVEDLIAPIEALPVLETKSLIFNALYEENRDEQQLVNALQSCENAIDLFANIRHQYQSEAYKLELSGKLTDWYEKAISTALQLYDITKNPIYQERAFFLSEKSKAAVLLEAMREAQARDLAQVPDSLVRQERYLKTELAHYKRLLSEQQIEPKIGQDSVQLLQSQLVEMRKHLDLYYPKLEEYKQQINTITATEARILLEGQNRAIVEYFVGKKTLFCFVLTSTDLTVFSSPIPSDFNKKIEQIRQELITPNNSSDVLLSFRRFTSAAHQLYKTILQNPVNQLITQNIAHLTIIPDEQLWFVPFEVLLQKMPSTETPNYSLENLDYLLEDFAISYANSATLLQQPKPQKAGEGFAGFAPQFTQGTAAETRVCKPGQLSTLNYNQPEVEQIQALLGGDAFLTEKATKATFLSQAKNFRLLHLATHACMDDQDPLYNKIHFTDAPLSTYEIYQMDLNADLIALSACETGVGKLQAGEGMMSLSRGFTMAGCPAILMSLWSVADEATAQIMVDFYTNLDNGQQKSTALQQAKINFIKTQSREKQYPFYWSAFTLIGDDEPLHTKGFPWLWLTLGSIGALIVFFFFKNRK